MFNEALEFNKSVRAGKVSIAQPVEQDFEAGGGVGGEEDNLPM
jgi:hypothetical protein